MTVGVTVDHPGTTGNKGQHESKVEKTLVRHVHCLSGSDNQMREQMRPPNRVWDWTVIPISISSIARRYSQKD
jgi:hypothetical protein